MQIEQRKFTVGKEWTGKTRHSCVHRHTRIAKLTESGSLMDTCSENRTLGGLVRSWAFLAALMKADLGD